MVHHYSRLWLVVPSPGTSAMVSNHNDGSIQVCLPLCGAVDDWNTGLDSRWRKMPNTRVLSEFTYHNAMYDTAGFPIDRNM